MCPIAETPSSTPAETMERMGRFPKQFVYLAVGLAQGLLLALLLNKTAVENPVLFSSLFIAAVLLPLAFYCSERATMRRRLWILGLTAVAIIAIGIYQGVTIGEKSHSNLLECLSLLSFTLALAIFVGIPALSVSAATWEERYRQWVAAALHAFGTLAQAGLVLALCWTVIASSVGLFVLIGADGLEKLVFNWNFPVIISSLVVALAVSRSRRDDSIMSTVFTRLMQLCGWIYPVIAVVGILFVASWVAGIEKLLETHKAATILLWFITLLIFFFNLHNRCGTEERGEKWLRILAALCWLASVPMLIVALYGLGVRVVEYGLTPDRIWGLFTAFIVAIFVFGYAAHSALELWQGQSGKRLISKTHLTATLALVAGIALMQVGILDPRWMSVHSQLQRLEKAAILDGRLTDSAIDVFNFFGGDTSGIYGKNALLELAARTESSTDKLIAQSAKLALAGERISRYEIQSKSAADALRSLKVFPGGVAPPPELIKALVDYAHDYTYALSEDCLVPQGAKPTCILWKVRFEENGTDNYVLLTKYDHVKPFGYGYSGAVWQKTGEGEGYWEHGEQLVFACSNAADALFTAVLENSVQLVPPQNPRKDILAGGIRITPPPPPRPEIFVNCP